MMEAMMGKQVPGKKLGMKPMPKMGGDMGQDMGDHGTGTFSVDQYPELQGMKEGAPISGEWDGTVEKNDGTNVTVRYTDMKLTTENKADKELGRIAGEGGAPTSAGEEQGE